MSSSVQVWCMWLRTYQELPEPGEAELDLIYAWSGTEKGTEKSLLCWASWIGKASCRMLTSSWDWQMGHKGPDWVDIPERRICGMWVGTEPHEGGECSCGGRSYYWPPLKSHPTDHHLSCSTFFILCYYLQGFHTHLTMSWECLDQSSLSISPARWSKKEKRKGGLMRGQSLVRFWEHSQGYRGLSCFI